MKYIVTAAIIFWSSLWAVGAIPATPAPEVNAFGHTVSESIAAGGLY